MNQQRGNPNMRTWRLRVAAFVVACAAPLAGWAQKPDLAAFISSQCIPTIPVLQAVANSVSSPALWLLLVSLSYKTSTTLRKVPLAG